MTNGTAIKYFISGGAGFIGSNMVERLLDEPGNEVTVFDNFSSGHMLYIKHYLNKKEFNLIEGDLLDLDFLIRSMKGHDYVFHFAANADIARSTLETDLDLKMTVLATYNIVEAMRVNDIKTIAYSSGSGVYGDVGITETPENFGPLLPISMYGASKLGAEGIIAAFCHMFDMTSYIFRFANVVGRRQTHGVGYDFVNRLKRNPEKLEILGDGFQSKSYIYIDDVLDAMFYVINNSSNQINIYNIATNDYITVNEIAEIAVKEMRLECVEFIYSGGKRGWKGDVPVVRFDLSKIHSLGWTSKYNSKKAISISIQDLAKEL